MELRTIAIMTILFSLMFMAFVNVYTDLQTTYGFTVDQDYSGTFNKINETFDRTELMANRMRNASGESNPELKLMRGALSSLSLVWNYFQTTWDVSNEVLMTITGFPEWVLPAFLTMVLLVIAFTIISAVLRQKV